MLLLACGPKSNLEDDSASTADDTSGPVTSTGPAMTATSSPTTATTAMTSDGPTSTTGVVPDMGATGVCGDGVCDDAEARDCFCQEDCGGCSLPEAVVFGCPAAWVGGSAVIGETKFGAFTGHTAFFAWLGVGNTAWSELRLFILDVTVDAEAAKKEVWSDALFALKLSPPWNQPDWVNQGIVDGAIVRDGQSSPHQALLEITGTAGNWQQFDPNDPPRLLGVIHPAAPNDPKPVDGAFDAAFCDSFVNKVFVE